MSQELQKRADRARQGSQRKRDRAALRAQGGNADPGSEGYWAEVKERMTALGRELFPEVPDESWWPIIGIAVKRFRRGKQTFDQELIARHLEDEGYRGAVAELLGEDG